MNKILIVFPLVFLLGLLAGCQKEAEEPELASPALDVAAETAAIEAVLGDNMKAWEREDLDLLSRTMAADDDMVIIGTDEAEYWIGFEPVRQAALKQFEAFDSLKASLSDIRIKVHKSGEVAWATGHMQFAGTAMGQPFDLKARMTCVLEKREGRWIIVHEHISMPVTGQAVKY